MPSNNPGTIRRNMKRGPIRRPRSAVNRPQPTVPLQILSADKVGATITVEYNNNVYLHSTPKYTTDVVGVTALSAVRTSPSTVEITFSASVAAATVLNIPYEEPGVRNLSGGFVADSTFPLA